MKLDRAKFMSYLNYARQKSNRAKTGMVLDIIYSVLVYKISIMEYFQFNFYRLGKEERKNMSGPRSSKNFSYE